MGEDFLALALIFQQLPPNCLTLTVAALNKSWRAWALNGKPSLPAITRRSYIPIWALEQQLPLLPQKLKAITEDEAQTDKPLILDHYGTLAMEHGILPAFQALFPYCSAFYQMQSAMFAAGYGQVPILQWLLKTQHRVSTTSICAQAARCGQLEVLQWVKDNPRCRIKDGTKSCVRAVAAKAGHLEVVKWAKDSGYPWNGASQSGVSNS